MYLNLYIVYNICVVYMVFLPTSLPLMLVIESHRPFMDVTIPRLSPFMKSAIYVMYSQNEVFLRV